MDEFVGKQLYKDIAELVPGFVYNPSVKRGDHDFVFGSALSIDREKKIEDDLDFLVKLKDVAESIKDFSKAYILSSPKIEFRHNPAIDYMVFHITFYGKRDMKRFQPSNM